jgi:aminobenzoyl-glutamate utilization protein B
LKFILHKEKNMEQMKKQALAGVDAKYDVYAEANDRIWEYAETAFEEFKSMETLCELLEQNGFAVEKGIGNLATAFKGTYGSGKPVIGILGEYDALSGLSQEGGNPVKTPIIPGAPGHGCGHNCFGVASVAAAVAAKEYLEATGKEGTVIFFGTPGEEGGSGKAFMAREGVFDGIDAAITWHPGTTNCIMTGSYLANVQVLYKFKGVSAHAAGDPHLGRSALDAVELMNVGVQFLREHMIDAARIHYAILDTGGYSPNVVQPKASVLYLIRAPKNAQVQELYARVNKIAQGAAMMTETELEIDFVKACSNMVINSTLEKALYKNMEAIPVPTYTEEEKAFAAAIQKSYENPGDEYARLMEEYGDHMTPEVEEKLRARPSLNDFLMPFITSNAVAPGSTDVGDVSWVAPTAQMQAVTTAAGTPGHSWQYVSCNKTSIAHKGVIYAGKVMGATVIDLIDNPEVLEAAKAEHKKRLGGDSYICPIPAGVAPRPIGKL